MLGCGEWGERESNWFQSRPSNSPAISSFLPSPTNWCLPSPGDELGRLVIDSWAICTIKFNGLHPLVWLCRCFQWITFSGANTDSLFLLFPFQRASAKSKNQTKTGTIPRRNPAWCSPTSNAEHSLPSSRRTNAHLKRCRSPFPSSWAWSSQPSATSSWTPDAAAWRSGRTTWAQQALHPPPALVPKHDGRTLSWAQVTSNEDNRYQKKTQRKKTPDS